MLKLVGILLVVSMGAMIGVTISGKFQQRTKQLLLCQSLFQQIKAHLEYQKTPTKLLIKQLTESEQFRSLLFLQYCDEKLKTGESFSIAWTSSLAQAKSQMGLLPSDYEVIEQLGNILGSYDAKAQIQSIELLLVQIKTKIDEAEERYKTDGKLARTLGILGGVAVGILLV